MASTPTSPRRSDRRTETVSGTSSSAVAAAQQTSATVGSPAAHKTSRRRRLQVRLVRQGVLNASGSQRPNLDLRDLPTRNLRRRRLRRSLLLQRGWRSGREAVLTKRQRRILPLRRHDPRSSADLRHRGFLRRGYGILRDPRARARRLSAPPSLSLQGISRRGQTRPVDAPMTRGRLQSTLASQVRVVLMEAGSTGSAEVLRGA